MVCMADRRRRAALERAGTALRHAPPAGPADRPAAGRVGRGNGLGRPVTAAQGMRRVRLGGRGTARLAGDRAAQRSEEHTSELQSLMRISYAVFCLKKKKTHKAVIPNRNSTTAYN